MTDFKIRDATAADGSRIAEFNCRMAFETEDRALEPDRVMAGVAAVLRDPARGRYWVAVSDDGVIGQLMITFEWSDWRNGFFWWIQSVYVDERHRRRGIFSGLYRHVESLARRDSRVCGLRLYVDHRNERAMEAYRRLGMSDPGYRFMEADFSAGD